MKKLVTTFGIIIAAFQLCADEFEGTVAKVVDGDTIWVMKPGHEVESDVTDFGAPDTPGQVKTEKFRYRVPPSKVKVRLDRIDAPESDQPYGKDAREELSSLIFLDKVKVVYKKRDQYGRILGIVYLNNEDINLKMVREGHAWHYSYFDQTRAYIDAEKEARAAKRGLWADPNPINPYKWRKGERGTTSASGDLGTQSVGSRREYFAGAELPVGRRKAAPVCDDWPDTGYWLSTNSNKRHNRKCENYRKTRGYPCKKGDGIPCKKCGG